MNEWSLDRKTQKSVSSRPKQDVREYIEAQRRKVRSGVNVTRLRASLRSARAHVVTLTAHYQIRERRHVEHYIQNVEKQLDDLTTGVTFQLFDETVTPYLELVQQIEEAEEKHEKAKSNHKRAISQVIDKSGNCRLLKKPKSQAVDDQMYDELSLRDELGLVLENESPPVYVGATDVCDVCNLPMVVMASEALLGCSKCSRVRPYLQSTSSRIPYGEEVEFSGFSYKRQNHFQEWLNAIQAKESTEVPNNVIEDIMTYMCNHNIRQQRQITPMYIRQVLKEMNLKKLYDHTMQIYVSITGNHPPRFTAFQEEQLRIMFEAIQGPFQKHCPPDRKNFLSYAYCLYKFCELLGYDHFLQYFTLLKGVDKLYKQDVIYKKICEELDWQFIPSSKSIQDSARQSDGFQDICTMDVESL